MFSNDGWPAEGLKPKGFLLQSKEGIEATPALSALCNNTMRQSFKKR